MNNDRIKQALDLIDSRRDYFRKSFPDWLINNWPIFQAFEREALKVWGKGRTHYSARTIMEFIRHETLFCELFGHFKVNDHVTPDCARLYMLFHPAQKGFFELRNIEKRATVSVDRAGAVAVQINQQREAMI